MIKFMTRKEYLVSNYIKVITGYDVTVEEIEGYPVIVKDGCYHLYLIPEFILIGTIKKDDIDFVTRVSQLIPWIQDIWDKNETIQ